MSYASLTNLIERFSGSEIVQRGWPEFAYIYLGQVVASADLATTYPAAVTDDVVLVTTGPAIWRYDGAAWAALNATRVDQVLADADATIDGYLTGRYALPLVTVPVVLTRISSDIARYLLYDDEAPPIVLKRYDGSIKELRSVAAGDISLGLTLAAAPATSAGGPTTSAPDRVFDTDTLADF